VTLPSGAPPRPRAEGGPSRAWRARGGSTAAQARGGGAWLPAGRDRARLAAAALILAQAGLLATVLATAGRGGATAALWTPLLLLLAVVAGRAVLNGTGEAVALRAAAVVKSRLRRALAARALRLGPAWLGGQQTGEITALATRGLDGLDAYFARYRAAGCVAVGRPRWRSARRCAGRGNQAGRDHRDLSRWPPPGP